jgi:hypothetical protein
MIKSFSPLFFVPYSPSFPSLLRYKWRMYYPHPLSCFLSSLSPLSHLSPTRLTPLLPPLSLLTPIPDDPSLSQTMNLISANDSYIASVEIAKPTEALIGTALSWLKTHGHLNTSSMGCASVSGDGFVTSSERELTLTGVSYHFYYSYTIRMYNF